MSSKQRRVLLLCGAALLVVFGYAFLSSFGAIGESRRVADLEETLREDTAKALAGETADEIDSGLAELMAKYGASLDKMPQTRQLLEQWAKEAREERIRRGEPADLPDDEDGIDVTVHDEDPVVARRDELKRMAREHAHSVNKKKAKKEKTPG